jgi:hypothetical protein
LESFGILWIYLEFHEKLNSLGIPMEFRNSGIP